MTSTLPPTPRPEGATHPRIAWFVFGLVLVFLVLFSISRTAWFDATIARPSLVANATLAAHTLRLFGEEVISSGAFIGSPRFFMEIGEGCDAIDPLLLFWSAVLASPVMFRARLVGVVAGGAALLALNQLRIVTLFYAGIHLRPHFEFVHLDLWQVFFIGLSLIVWLFWARWALTLRPTEAS